jgi:hypothetical protein
MAAQRCPPAWNEGAACLETFQAELKERLGGGENRWKALTYFAVPDGSLPDESSHEPDRSSRSRSPKRSGLSALTADFDEDEIKQVKEVEMLCRRSFSLFLCATSDPVKLTQEFAARVAFVKLYIGLTTSPPWRFFHCHGNDFKPHSKWWRRMFVIAVLRGDKAAKLEIELIRRFSDCDKFVNKLPGGEHKQADAVSYVYILANTVKDVDDTAREHRSFWRAA